MTDQYDQAVQEYDNDNFQEAYSIFLSLAEKGDVASQKMVANMLIHGIGIEKNESQGYEWYKNAALNGDSESMFWTAMHFFEHSNFNDGMHFLTTAVNGNYPHAVFWMGNIYYYGMYTVDKNLIKAQEYYEQAVQLGVDEAKAALLKTIAEKDGKMEAFKFAFKKTLFRS